MTYLKASLVGLALASPLAFAYGNNDSGVMSNPIHVGVALKVQSEVEGYTSTSADTTVDGRALANLMYDFKEAGDKYPRLNFGGTLSASTELNDSLGATAFFEIMAGAKDSKTHNLDDNGANPLVYTVEHKMSYAPGVYLNYGCWSVGLKYNMIENNVKESSIGKLEEKAIQVGFATTSSLDLDDSMGAISIGFDAWTTLGRKSESEAKTFFGTAAGASGGAVGVGAAANTITDTYYHLVTLGFTFGFELTQM